MATTMATLLPLLAAADPHSPVVTLFPDTNNVAGAPWRVGGGSDHVAYLGLYNTTAQCEWACLRGPPPLGAHCCSFTFHTAEYEPRDQIAL